MKIVAARARIIDVGQGFVWGGRKPTNVHGVHVELEADNGLKGDALGWPGDLPAASVVAAFDEKLVPTLVGADAHSRPGILEPAWRAFRVGMPFPAIGLADVALWDLAGKHAGLSVAQMLGQKHLRLKSCASAPTVFSPEDAMAMTEEILAEGFLALKLHSCGDLQTDIQVCESVRQKAGGEIDLMMDVMALYDRRSALALGQVLDELDYRWFEDPLPDTDLDGWRELRSAIATPLAGVDAVRFTTAEYARPMADGCFDIVRMDGARNGISQLSELSVLARAVGLGCEGHAFGPALAQAANLQVGLCSANAEFCELPVPLGALDYGVGKGLQLDADGYVVPPLGAGLGLEVDREALERGVLL